MEKLDQELKQRPIADSASFLAAEELAQELRLRDPLVASDSVDVVVSNCVLNLVETKSKRQLFEEIFRVLKKGGRAVISDIVSDEAVPERLQNDPQLWSGCISGALTEEGFLQAFADAGFYGMQILKRDDQPWRTVDGIEFRSVTIAAYKGEQGPVPPEQASPFDSSGAGLRPPRETKGRNYNATQAGPCCDGGCS